MPPSLPARSAATTRLPPLPKLRVRRPNRGEANPCLGMLSNVLTCWASSNYSAQGCAGLEQGLRACMDAPRPTDPRKNTLNYHLSRLYPKLIGPRKRK